MRDTFHVNEVLEVKGMSDMAEGAVSVRPAKFLTLGLLGVSVLALLGVLALALWAPLNETDAPGSTIDTNGNVISPAVPSVSESIFQKDGYIVVVQVGVALSLAVLTAVLLIWWIRNGSDRARKAAFALSGVLLLGGIAGLVTFVVGGVLIPIAIMLILACAIAPPPRGRSVIGHTAP